MNRILTASLASTAMLAGLALAVGSGPGNAADVAGSPARSATTTTTTTKFVAHDMAGNLALADLAEPHGEAPDIGDLLVFTQRLTRGGRTVGKVSNLAVGVDHQSNLFQSSGTLRLAGGHVSFAGLVSQTSHFVMAVTGGTGRYVGADGTLTFDNVRGRQLLTLKLIR